MRLAYRALIVAIFAFMLGPLVVPVAISFNSGTVTVFPPHDLSLRWYGAALRNPNFLPAVTNSVLLGAGAAALGCGFGTLPALGLRRWSGRSRHPISTPLLAPLVVPCVFVGIALLTTLAAFGL